MSRVGRVSAASASATSVRRPAGSSTVIVTMLGPVVSGRTLIRSLPVPPGPPVLKGRSGAAWTTVTARPGCVAGRS